MMDELYQLRVAWEAPGNETSELSKKGGSNCRTAIEKHSQYNYIPIVVSGGLRFDSSTIGGPRQNETRNSQAEKGATVR